MKILHCLASLDPASGGPARSVPQLALSLARQGHEVGLWSPDPLQRALPDLPADAHQRIRVFSGDFSVALEDFGMPDLVHDHGIWLPCHRTVAKECAGRGIPRMVSPRGMLEPWALNHKKWKKRLAWHLYQQRDLQTAAALHATAEQEAAQLRRLGLSIPILVAANGVDLPLPPPVGTPEREVATRFPAADAAGSSTSTTHIPDFPKTALFLSRVHPKKGLPLLIEAWARLMPAGWRMRVVGPDEGGHRGELRAAAMAAGVSGVWSFEDSLEGDAKWQALAAADLFILPSHSENFGIVVAEALACGTPVITTTGTPWEGLHAHGCGWWVKPTAADLADALRAALALDDASRAAMGARGRDWVKRDFGWDGIACKVAAFYTALPGATLRRLGRESGPAPAHRRS